MASQDLAVVEETESESGLDTRQIQALEKLTELGAAPRTSTDEPYSSNPKVRAYQLIFERRFAGPGRGQGRVRKPRMAEAMAEEMRRRGFGRKMLDALDRALDVEAGEKTNLDAIKIAIDIENKEAALKLREDESDEIGSTKDEVLATLFQLVSEPHTAAAIEGTAEEDDQISEAVIVSEDADESPRQASSSRTNGHRGNSGPAQENRSNGRNSGSNGRARTAKDREASPSPLKKAAVRRAAKR